MGKRSSTWLALAWLAVTLLGCDRGVTADTPLEPSKAAERETASRGAVGGEGLLIGLYPLAAKPVIDGDTIRVNGIESSIRLISLDTEERFHGRAERADATQDFEGYLERRRGDSRRPTKTGTPMGERATEFAIAFFEGAEVVRLERDDPKELRGHYGRPLAYALIQKDGRWTSYNEECIRAGMSPYFTKYGYSRRFHNDFSHAEAEARRAGRGIWDPNSESYGDYDERKAWWNARADFIRAFEHEANRRDDFILLSHWDAAVRLESKLGEEVTVLSTVTRIKHFKTLVRVSLAMERNNHFPIIFFDREVFGRSGLAEYDREPIRVRGRVERYTKGEYSTLQIVVTDPSQVTTPALPSVH